MAESIVSVFEYAIVGTEIKLNRSVNASSSEQMGVVEEIGDILFDLGIEQNNIKNPLNNNILE